MNTCRKTHVITANMNADGNVDIDIKSNCEKIRDLNERLKYLTMTDVTDYYNSRLLDEKVRGPIGHICLIINAVAHAAWMEYGLLSEGHAKKSGNNSILYSEDGVTRYE